jgi:hypothetical protein
VELGLQLPFEPSQFHKQAKPSVGIGNLPFRQKFQYPGARFVIIGIGVNSAVNDVAAAMRPTLERLPLTDHKHICPQKGIDLSLRQFDGLTPQQIQGLQPSKTVPTTINDFKEITPSK